jgi:copper(I)-binding protein
MLLARVLLAAAVAFVVVACGGGAAELTIEGAWVRSNPNLMGAAYMVITSPDADELVAASVDPAIAGTVEVHEVVMDAGMMRMREVAGIPLPAGEAVALEPGGYHLMLLDMPEMLAPGTAVELTLAFASGTTRTVSAEVRTSTMPEDPGDHLQGDHPHGGHMQGDHLHGDHMQGGHRP